jgi:y4mF family transcriptional regulator
MYPIGNIEMNAKTPFEQLADAMAAYKDPLAQLKDAIDPPHLRALRQSQDELFGPTKGISALGDSLKTAAIFKDSAPYRSPARDLLDQLGTHRNIKPANLGRHVSPPPLPVPPVSGTKDAIPITSTLDIGQRVREVRRGMGMTQQRFADMAGVGRRFLIELEKGKASLEIGRVLAVCQAAGITLGIVA